MALLVAGCDYSGDFLFSNQTEVPPIVHLGEIEPVDVTTAAELKAATRYGQVGATGSSARGGVTFTFVGTGSSVCVWMDPEAVFWNQSVSRISPVDSWMWPDNVFDDGDIDMAAGFAVYYSGSPASTAAGGEIGDFEIRYEDSLGNEIPIELNECTQPSLNSNTGGFAGRSAPEYCTLAATQPGVNYLVKLETMATPLDDDRMGFGLFLVNGDCSALLGDGGAAEGVAQECVITGEIIDPSTTETNPETGEMLSGEPYADSIAFEEAFCGATVGGLELLEFCEDEAANKNCATEHCFCGDPGDAPVTADTGG